MINLIKWLIFGHIHKYEEVERAEIKCKGKPCGRVYIMRCKCGKMTEYRVD